MATPDLIHFSSHFSTEADSKPWSAKLVGRKAIGLSLLPPDWTPPFFTFAPSKKTGGTRKRALEDAINKLASLGSQNLIVRSSATDESLNDRGRFQSMQCDANLAAVLAAAHAIESHFEVISERSQPSTARQMRLIVQQYITSKAVGHLSNERRVSREVTSWHLEEESSDSAESRVTMFSTKGSSGQRTPPRFDCSKRTNLVGCLRSIASFFGKRRKRQHIEWLWDGTRIWIVQCDEELPFRGQLPGSRWRAKNATSTDRKFHDLRHALEASQNWPKIQAVRTFATCDLPVADVYVLEDGDILRELAGGTVRRTLRADLTRLLASPVLIRTDYSEKVLGSGMLLPRTGAIRSVRQALGFLRKNTKENIDGGIAESEFCFTLHNFISARGAAFSLSKPGISRVHIDSTWGSPDSLSFYPHDSFEVDTRDRQILARRIRCKTHYLDMDANGDWREVQSGEPWDWKESLSRTQLFEIAQAACRVADYRQNPIEVMFFTGVTLPTGSVCCLPWFCTDKFRSSIAQTTGIRFSGRRITVRNREDAKWIRDQWQSGELRKPFSIRLRPQPELLRSTELLTEIAQVAKTADVAVELEGSVLSHCYYILRSNSAKVCCVDALDQRLPKHRFGKLVRDKIPLRIEAHGERPLYLRVKPDQLLRLLKAKAVEESLELFWEDGSAQTISELTDLLEVIDSVSRLCGTSLDELLEAAQVKRDERGGFRDGLVLLETRAVPLIPRERRGRGLFEDEEIASDTEHASVSNASNDEWLAGEVRQPRSDASALLISLVPPDWARNRKQVVLPIHDGTHEAIISYTACDIRVVFQRRVRHADDPRQLKLAFTG